MKQIVTKKCKSFSLTDEMKPPGQLPLSLTNGFEWANQHLDPVWQNLKKPRHCNEGSWNYEFFSSDGFYFYLPCFSGSGSGVIAEKQKNKSFPVMSKHQAFKKMWNFSTFFITCHLPGRQNIFSNFPDLAGAYGNMKSLYAKFQPFSFKTEGGDRGWRTVKMQNFNQPLFEQKFYLWFLLDSLSWFNSIQSLYCFICRIGIICSDSLKYITSRNYCLGLYC